MSQGRAGFYGTVGGGLIDQIHKAVQDYVHCLRLSLVVAVVHQEQIFFRHIQPELAAHAVEEEAVVVADPDLVAVSLGVPSGNAVEIVVDLFGGCQAYIFRIQKLFAVPGTAVGYKTHHPQHIL